MVLFSPMRTAAITPPSTTHRPHSSYRYPYRKKFDLRANNKFSVAIRPPWLKLDTVVHNAFANQAERMGCAEASVRWY